jgi:hypothetical protein
MSSLGFASFSNLSLPLSERPQTPDYLLFRDEATKTSVFNESLDTKFANACGLLEAKKVFTPLDAKNREEVRFPHQQLRDYLEAATDNIGRPYFRWGILSNGNEWRLYCRDSHPSQFFSFHLSGEDRHFCSLEEFRAFVTLFSARAFIEESGTCLLDQIRSEAIQFQTELEESIRKRIFGVVTQLANGFWRFEENSLDESDLPLLYEACLIFLYRLLFVLYAEARGLLPTSTTRSTGNPLYKEKYSLRRLVPKLSSPREFTSPDISDLYEELLKLFSLIDGSSPNRNRASGVPRYNGGLFDPKHYSSIGKWRIDDLALAGVLRELMFSPVTSNQREFNLGTIDYADLEVRQLGDVYEALLGGRLVPTAYGTLELMGERTSLQESGTFYTPDWVVQFLVERALRPLVDQIAASGTVREAVASGAKNGAFAAAVLQLRIVDPAMGSGHFLVRVTEWLAYEIVRHPTTPPHSASQSTVDERETIAHWRRRVVESCIFGVDLNPLAVELAKLSLWLTCIAANEPLSFLDHHIRLGNALVSAPLSRLSRLQTGDSSGNALELGVNFENSAKKAIQGLLDIESSLSDSIEKVKEKESMWKVKVLPALIPYRTLAGVWLAALGGEPISQFDYVEIAAAAEASQKHLERCAPYREHRAAIQDVQRKLLPINWELEFPEVFFDESGNRTPSRGFDAVVGNPPYISTQTSRGFEYLGLLDKLDGYLDDLYLHFIELGFRILRPGGQFAFIVSDTFFTLATKLRARQLLQQNSLKYLVQCDPFNATVDAAMFVCEKSNESSDSFFFIQARYSDKNSTPEKQTPLLRELLLPLITASNPFHINGNSYPVLHSQFNCLRLHKCAVEPYRQSLKACFFEPTDAAILLYNRLMTPWKDVVNGWLEKFDSAKNFAEYRDEIMAYQRTLKPGDVTVIGLVSEGAQGMRTGNNGRYLGHPLASIVGQLIPQRREQLKADWLNRPNLRSSVVTLENDSCAIEILIDKMREKFADRELGLRKGEIYRTVNADQIATLDDFRAAYQYRAAELFELWVNNEDVSKLLPHLISEFGRDAVVISNALRDEVALKRLSPRSTGLRNGEIYTEENKESVAAIYSGIPTQRCWVPYRKGDSEGNRWLTPETLMIQWSTKNVRELQSSEKSRWQGTGYFFQPGVTWTLHANHVALKARIQPPCVFDASGSRLTPFGQVLSSSQFLAILNSDLFSYIVKKFVKNTQDYEINDLRMAPIVLPTSAAASELGALADTAVKAKQLVIDGRLPSGEFLFECKRLATKLESAPTYLRPYVQLALVDTAEDCLQVAELNINWAVERLYGVEGLGPFDEF